MHFRDEFIYHNYPPHHLNTIFQKSGFEIFKLFWKFLGNFLEDQNNRLRFWDFLPNVSWDFDNRDFDIRDFGIRNFENQDFDIRDFDNRDNEFGYDSIK